MKRPFHVEHDVYGDRLIMALAVVVTAAAVGAIAFLLFANPGRL